MVSLFQVGLWVVPIACGMQFEAATMTPIRASFL
jgi:hypothetical protein